MSQQLYRRCGCRDDNGRQLGPNCPKLKTDLKHGTWAYYLSAGTDPKTRQRRQFRKTGYPTRKVADQALTEVIHLYGLARTSVCRRRRPDPHSHQPVQRSRKIASPIHLLHSRRRVKIATRVKRLAHYATPLADCSRIFGARRLYVVLIGSQAPQRRPDHPAAPRARRPSGSRPPFVR
jgi:hypothetical protein